MHARIEMVGCHEFYWKSLTCYWLFDSGNWETSVPISYRMVWAVIASASCTLVRTYSCRSLIAPEGLSPYRAVRFGQLFELLLHLPCQFLRASFRG